MLPAGRFVAGGVVVLLSMWCSAGALAMDAEEAAQLLHRAETVKSSNYAEFASITQRLTAVANDLSADQQMYLGYLRGWQFAYLGDYAAALPQLEATIDAADDDALRFRARATLVNVLSIARHYERAFSQLNELLESLPAIVDASARQQGLSVAALLHSQIGQYDTALMYAQQLAQESVNERGACTAAELKLRIESLHAQSRTRLTAADFQSGIDTCSASGEAVFANLIRTYLARWQISRGLFADAIALLSEHYESIVGTRYPPLISGGDVLLAQAHHATGNASAARSYAAHAIESEARNQYAIPIVAAYRLLYLLARERGDTESALAFHEKYATADKGYLDDLSARQLAYERVKHEVAANKLQIDALNKQNQVLKLERELDAKAIENVRLYVTLLVVIVAFIGFWAYRTKLSQLHFMRLSRRDGLTGIFNRPHFLELAASTLENCRKLQQSVSLVLCDIDHFKAINDRFGHAEGDTVLRRMVAACQEHLRATDVFARVGGEEFCILLPGCSVDDARQRAERLRAAIAAINHIATVSASLGVTGTHPSGYEIRQLMAHADHALYQAKRAGRNCVIVYDPASVVTELRPGAASIAV